MFRSSISPVWSKARAKVKVRNRKKFVRSSLDSDFFRRFGQRISFAYQSLWRNFPHGSNFRGRRYRSRRRKCRSDSRYWDHSQRIEVTKEEKKRKTEKISSFRLKDLELAKKAGEDLEKKVVRGNDKTLKTDYVRFVRQCFSLFLRWFSFRKRWTKWFTFSVKNVEIFVLLIGTKKKSKFWINIFLIHRNRWFIS